MDTIFGKFIERTIPSLKNAIIKILIGGKEAEMNLEDFKAAMAPEPIPAPYKVYTALLTQSGSNDPQIISSGNLTIGVTYFIDEAFDNSGADFTNVGAPNNNFGTYFVATGTTPNSWGEEGSATSLIYNTGAPVVKVLENTIGNIWFTYEDIGLYNVNSDDLFTSDKTLISFMPSIYIESPADIYNFTGNPSGVNVVSLRSMNNYELSNDRFGNYAQNAIEIRVYN